MNYRKAYLALRKYILDADFGPSCYCCAWGGYDDCTGCYGECSWKLDSKIIDRIEKEAGKGRTFIEPRYDDVYFEGLKWLDKLAFGEEDE
jgi:hypothetical protein